MKSTLKVWHVIGICVMVAVLCSSITAAIVAPATVGDSRYAVVLAKALIVVWEANRDDG